MIHRVFADNDSFNEVNFSSGLNIILGSKDANSDDNDTRNGVGKTLLIKIINFCLGSNNDLKDIEMIKNWTFSLEMDLFDEKYIISRSVSTPNKIYVDGDLSKIPIKPSKDLYEPYFHVKKWNKILGYCLFNLDIDESEYYPQFSSLISYFIRHKEESYNITPFKYYTSQSKIDSDLNTTYLLGLNSEFSYEANKMNNEERKLNRELNSLERLYEPIEKMKSTETILDNELNEKNKLISSFKVHEEYKDIENEVNELTSNLNSIENNNIFLQRKLEMYNNSIKIEKSPKTDLLKKLYAEIDDLFTLKTKKTLNEVREFHETLINNRKEFLKEEITNLENEIANNERLIEEYDDKRSKLLNILNAHHALDEFNLLQDRLFDLKSEKIILNDNIAKYEKIEKSITEIKNQRPLLYEKITEKENIYEDKRKKAITMFDKNCKYLYNETGRLIIDISEKGYNFDIDFPKKGSTGISKMKIFCYDVMIQEINSKRNNIDFLIHDSEMFSDVDSRQVAKAISLIKDKCDENNLQYIFTINSDELDIIQNEISSDINLYEYVKLKLIDKDPKKHLLGFRF